MLAVGKKGYCGWLRILWDKAEKADTAHRFETSKTKATTNRRVVWSDNLVQATFSMGLKGVKPENVNKVEELMMDTLKKVAEEGFPEDAQHWIVPQGIIVDAREHEQVGLRSKSNGGIEV